MAIYSTVYSSLHSSTTYWLFHIKKLQKMYIFLLIQYVISTLLIRKVLCTVYNVTYITFILRKCRRVTINYRVCIHILQKYLIVMCNNQIVLNNEKFQINIGLVSLNQKTFLPPPPQKKKKKNQGVRVFNRMKRGGGRLASVSSEG